MAKPGTKRSVSSGSGKKTSQPPSGSKAVNTSQNPIKWFKPLSPKGDFSAATLDGYFTVVQAWIEDDMAFLRKPIDRWRKRAYWLRGLAFLAVAAGILLPLPIMESRSGFPDGLQIGYLAVILGGLVLLLDRVYNVSSSWIRLTLAEMQVKQVRYRLDLDWAKQRPALTADNGASQGPILIDLLRGALDATHQIMETQKTAWTTELTQAMDALRARLDADRTSLEQLRTERQREQASPNTGGVTIKIDKPELLKGPLKIRAGSLPEERVDPVPPVWAVVGLSPGSVRVIVEAERVNPAGSSYKAAIPVDIAAGQVREAAFKV